MSHIDWKRGCTRWVILATFVLILIVLFYPMVLYRRGIVSFQAFPLSMWYLGAAAVVGLGAALLYAGEIDRRQLEAHARREAQLEIKEQALRALREQRHDVLNELTLALSYLELGRTKDAYQCLEFLAAYMSDRYQPHSLPEDAWLTIIRAKEEEAARRGITLETRIEGPPPADPTEQRLLPRLIGNLLDNAFDAAEAANYPRVTLAWEEQDQRRRLAVTNNGTPLPEGVDKETLIQPGYTTKEGVNRGWGLTICDRLSKELGGAVRVKSTKTYTTFTLELPAEAEQPSLRRTG